MTRFRDPNRVQTVTERTYTWYGWTLTQTDLRRLNGLILLAFFRTLLKLPVTGKALWLALPFLVLVVWDLAFLSALLYQPERLPALTGFMPVVIAVNMSASFSCCSWCAETGLPKTMRSWA